VNWTAKHGEVTIKKSIDSRTKLPPFILCLACPEGVLLSPVHTKIVLMKHSVKAMDQNNRAHARGENEGILSGSKNRDIMRDRAIDEIISEVEGIVGQHSKCAPKFLRKRKGEN
jgi:predicted methyltransferase MtxX (methanogen marker protein 4)